MKRFVLAAAVALASITLIPTAHAQLPREAGFNEIFTSDFMPRDVTLFVDFLELEDWQKPVLETLLTDYMAEYRAGEQGLRDKLTAMKDQITGAGQNGALAVLMTPIEEWKAEKERMKQRFLDDVKGQLSDAQLERWGRLERALRREKLLPQGRFSGERSDWVIVIRQMDVPVEVRAASKDAIEAYEVALDVALAARAAQQELSQPKIRQSMTNEDYALGLAELERIVAARVAVRAVNDEHVALLAAALGSDWGPKFQGRAMRDAYPLACRTSPLDPFFENVLALEDLSPEQIAQINALRGVYDQSMDNLTTRFVAKVREAEPQRETEKVRLAADRSRNVDATKGEQEPYKPLIEERDRLIEDTRTRILAMLTEEQQSKVPGIEKYRKPEVEHTKQDPAFDKKRQGVEDTGRTLSPDGLLGNTAPSNRSKSSGGTPDAPR